MSSPVSVHANGTQFVALVRAMGVGRGDPLVAEGFAARAGRHGVAEAIRKGVITPLSEADAIAVMRPFALDLSAALRPLTIIGRLTAARTVPMRTRVIVASGGATGAFVAEGAPAPMSALSLGAAETIEPAKVVATLVQTQEVFEQGGDGTQDLLRADLLATAVQAADAPFIAPDNAGATGKPASVTHGGVQIASSGSSLANVDADLRALIDAHIAAGNTLETAILVGHPRTLAYIGSLRGTGGAPAFPDVGAKGGFIWGISVIASASCAMGGSPTESVLALIEQSEILIADDGRIEVSSTSHAAVQLNDAPAAGAQQLVSLWQNGLIGVKVERWINWKTRRAGAASSLISINY